MNPRFLTDDLSVSKQITPEEIALIKQQGFKSIICNRPDNEEPSQADFEAVKSEADKQGLEICYLPVVSGQITNNDITQFQTALETLPTPIMAYCRSGTRCTSLWALSMRGTLSNDEILQRASDAGYDMQAIISSY